MVPCVGETEPKDPLRIGDPEIPPTAIRPHEIDGEARDRPARRIHGANLDILFRLHHLTIELQVLAGEAQGKSHQHR